MKKFLYVGRFVKRKGIIFLAKVWEDVVKQHPDYYLYLLGSGELQPDSCEEELKKINNKNIKIIKLTNNTKKYYEESDVFIFPSEREGLSNVLLEAMSMELPIIATEIGGNIELIEDRKTGLLFKPNDKDGILKAINNIFKYKKLGINARKKIEKEYSLDKISERYINLYEHT